MKSACRYLLLLVCICTIGVAGGASSAALAQNVQPDAAVNNGCVTEVAGFHVTCTANDVQLTGIIDSSVVILDDGCVGLNDTVTFTANATIQLTTQARYDIGIYISRDGDPNFDQARSGQCSISTL